MNLCVAAEGREAITNGLDGIAFSMVPVICLLRSRHLTA